MPSVYSTASNDIFYGIPIVRPDGVAIQDRRVLVKGKATISPGKGLKTPLGMRTDVTQEELDFLMTVPSFNRHMKAGHITVTGGKKDPEEVVKDMVPNDKSSPKMVTAKASSETPVGIKKKAKAQ